MAGTSRCALTSAAALLTLHAFAGFARAAEVPFGSATNLSGGAGVFVVRAGDLDGDGDLDVVAARGGGTPELFWHRNTDGAGSFSAAISIAATEVGVDGLELVDLDGNGTLDVVVATGSDKQLLWYENNGSGVFSAAKTIDGSLNSGNAVATGDFDGDGHVDAVVKSSSGEPLKWWENDGTPGEGGADRETGFAPIRTAEHVEISNGELLHTPRFRGVS